MTNSDKPHFRLTFYLRYEQVKLHIIFTILSLLPFSIKKLNRKTYLITKQIYPECNEQGSQILKIFSHDKLFYNSKQKQKTQDVV